jgi:hypothetical protein
MPTPTADLYTTALAMGDRLPAVVVLMSEMRDASAAAGDTARARFWSAQAEFLAQIRDEYAAALRAMEENIADAYVVVVPDEGGTDELR